MNTLICTLSILFGLFILALLVVIRLSVKLQLRITSQQVRILITIGFLFSVIPVRILLSIDKNRMTSLPELSLVKSDGSKKTIIEVPNILKEKKQSKFKKALNKSIIKGVDLKRIQVSGRLGIHQNAFATCIFTGGTALFFQNAVGMLVSKKNQKHCGIFINPEFNRSIFRINLESILIVKPEQIIYAALKLYYSQKKKGENNVASN